MGISAEYDARLVYRPGLPAVASSNLGLPAVCQSFSCTVFFKSPPPIIRMLHAQICTAPLFIVQVWCLAVSTMGDFAVTSGADRALRVWQRTEEPFFVEEEKEKRLESLFEADLEVMRCPCSDSACMTRSVHVFLRLSLAKRIRLQRMPQATPNWWTPGRPSVAHSLAKVIICP